MTNQEHKIFKDKLNSIEFEYNEGSWKKFEQKLPKQPKRFNKYIYSSLAAVVIATAIFFISKSNNNNQEQHKSKTEQFATIKTNNTDLNQNIKIEQNTETKKENQQILSNQKQEPKIPKEKPIRNNHPAQNIKNNNNNTDSKIVIEHKNCNLKENNSKEKPLKASCNFIINTTEGCAPLKVLFYPETKNISGEYSWDFGDGNTSEEQFITHIYENPGTYYPLLIVKCSKTGKEYLKKAEKPIIVKPSPIADFSITNDNNFYEFKNTSTGMDANKWLINNEEIGTDLDLIKEFEVSGTYNITLLTENIEGCISQADKSINIEIKYFMDQQLRGFIPNGDELTGTWKPIIYPETNLQTISYKLVIFSKSGQVVFETTDYNEKWDGKIQGTNTIAEKGVYAYVAVIKDKKGNIDERKGSVTLLKR